MRWVRGCLLCTFVLLPASEATAQLSATAAYSRSAYGSGDYSDTRGDWQAEAAIRYRVTQPLRFGVGVSVGKLDEPYSDPSFTSFGLFLEPSTAFMVRPRLQVAIGGRYGLAHERVGEESGGFWAWGWEAGAVSGLDYEVRTRVGLGVQVELMHLDLRRDEETPPPVSGLDREGWRTAVGAVLRVGAP